MQRLRIDRITVNAIKSRTDEASVRMIQVSMMNSRREITGNRMRVLLRSDGTLNHYYQKHRASVNTSPKKMANFGHHSVRAQTNPRLDAASEAVLDHAV